jgi:regulator of protease activity HflC (stomatin/prohibitin superfamily)
VKLQNELMLGSARASSESLRIEAEGKRHAHIVAAEAQAAAMTIEAQVHAHTD